MKMELLLVSHCLFIKVIPGTFIWVKRIVFSREVLWPESNLYSNYKNNFKKYTKSTFVMATCICKIFWSISINQSKRICWILSLMSRLLIMEMDFWCKKVRQFLKDWQDGDLWFLLKLNSSTIETIILLVWMLISSPEMHFSSCSWTLLILWKKWNISQFTSLMSYKKE